MLESKEAVEVFKKAQIISLAITFSVFFYGALAYFLTGNIQLHSEINIAFWRGVFIFLALTLLFLTKFCKDVLLKRGEAGVLSEKTMLSQLLNSTVVAMAVCESISVLGLVLCVLANDINEYFLFGLLSLTGIMFFFPKIHLWQTELN